MPFNSLGPNTTWVTKVNRLLLRGLLLGEKRIFKLNLGTEIVVYFTTAFSLTKLICKYLHKSKINKFFRSKECRHWTVQIYQSSYIKVFSSTKHTISPNALPLCHTKRKEIKRRKTRSQPTFASLCWKLYVKYKRKRCKSKPVSQKSLHFI